ncbi:platelet glycoprotein IX isoform X1 [Chelonoidis abingdonii]|uniref:platelet glycoprotein IX isoform X1 n=2 Tax=Chelonoidis abingdonii TaxID=106734 RepID=UPI0013F22B7B|nr:platelet glycoprotein IX [Chelonoidis abingdonii]
MERIKHSHTQSENIITMKIPAAAGFVTLMLFCLVHAEICPLSCTCKPLEEMKGWLVDCSSKGLKEVPALPVNTRKLYLQNNSMTTVRTGAFDNLQNLEEVNVSDNPWNCDCDILYLKLWLEDFSESFIANVICATPASSERKPLSQLSGNELDSCRKSLPIKCLNFFWRDLALITFAVVVLILTSCALRFSKRLAYQVTTRDYYSAAPLLRKHNLENYMSQ